MALPDFTGGLRSQRKNAFLNDEMENLRHFSGRVVAKGLLKTCPMSGKSAPSLNTLAAAPLQMRTVSQDRACHEQVSGKAFRRGRGPLNVLHPGAIGHRSEFVECSENASNHCNRQNLNRVKSQEGWARKGILERCAETGKTRIALRNWTAVLPPVNVC